MLEESINRYAAAANSVAAAYAGITQELAIRRPVPNAWSALEVLCHLVDTDLIAATRIRTTLVSAVPRITAISHDEMSTILASQSRVVDEELALFLALRVQTTRVLRALSPESFHRQAVFVQTDGHETNRSVTQFLDGITAHVHHHLGFVHAKRRELGLPL